MAFSLSKIGLTGRILIGMGLGLAVGVLYQQLAPLLPAGLSGFLQGFLIEGVFVIGGQIFVRSLQLLVVPLVFLSLVSGVAQLGGGKRLGRMGLKTLLFYMGTTAIAITVALSLANLTDPGRGIELESDAELELQEAPGLVETLTNVFPSNPVKAMAEGNMLQIIVFALLLGLAISRMPGERGERIIRGFSDLDDVIMRLVLMLMELAPYGVFCLIASLFADKGLGVIGDLAIYFFTVLGALALHGFIVYPALLTLLARLNPLVFLLKIRPLLLFAFSTASSNATLPVTINTLEKRLGVKNSIAAFTAPLGATVNMDGTAIMQGAATVFIAQAYGLDLSVTQYLIIIAMATLASIGAAGVPGVGLITLSMVLLEVGLPPEGIGLIIGVDRLLDMARTAVNVTGDCVVSSVIARSEGELDEAMFEDPEAGRDAKLESDRVQAD